MAHLHLHPDRLRTHAVTAAGLAEELRAALHDPPDGDEIPVGVHRAVAELVELAAELAAAAAACETADQDVAGSFGRLGEPGAI